MFTVSQPTRHFTLSMGYTTLHVCNWLDCMATRPSTCLWHFSSCATAIKRRTALDTARQPCSTPSSTTHHTTPPRPLWHSSELPHNTRRASIAPLLSSSRTRYNHALSRVNRQTQCTSCSMSTVCGDHHSSFAFLSLSHRRAPPAAVLITRSSALDSSSLARVDCSARPLPSTPPRPPSSSNGPARSLCSVPHGLSHPVGWPVRCVDLAVSVRVRSAVQAQQRPLHPPPRHHLLSSTPLGHERTER